MLIFVSKMPAFKGVAGKRVYDPFRPGRFVDRTTAFTIYGLDKAELERLKNKPMSYIKKASMSGPFTAPTIQGSGAYRSTRFMRMKRGRVAFSFGRHPMLRIVPRRRSRSRSIPRPVRARLFSHSRSKSRSPFVSPPHTRSGKGY